jgi:hypothetical protein
MAGPFTHLAVVNVLFQSDGGVAELDKSMRIAVRLFANYCELGAVSPDCPSLVFTDASAKGWGNVMHYWKTSNIIRQAVPFIHEMNYSTRDARKCMAWLFGYTAHVVTDLTVHPVVAKLVGDYKQNKTKHGQCELNQDAYIFPRMNLGDVTRAEFISDCGIKTCCQAGSKKLDPVIDSLWKQSLAEIKIGDINMANGAAPPTKPPAPAKWFAYYVELMDRFAEEGGKLPILSRLLTNSGLAYPDADKVDMKFVEALPTPTGETIHYQHLFEKAVENTKNAWANLNMALASGVANDFDLPNADLDTGKTESGDSIYWKTT